MISVSFCDGGLTVELRLRIRAFSSSGCRVLWVPCRPDLLVRDKQPGRIRKRGRRFPREGALIASHLHPREAVSASPPETPF